MDLKFYMETGLPPGEYNIDAESRELRDLEGRGPRAVVSERREDAPTGPEAF